MTNLDSNLITSAIQFTNQHDWFEPIVYFIAEYLIVLFAAVLFYLWRRPEVRGDKHGPKKAVILSLMAVIVALAIKTAITFLYVRDRPFEANPDLLALSFRLDPQSFPSGHTLIAFAIATSLLLSGYGKLGTFLQFCALLIGVSRVFAGVHYPSDVLAGAMMGIFVAWYLHREAHELKRYLPNR